MIFLGNIKRLFIKSTKLYQFFRFF